MEDKRVFRDGPVIFGISKPPKISSETGWAAIVPAGFLLPERVARRHVDGDRDAQRLRQMRLFGIDAGENLNLEIANLKLKKVVQRKTPRGN